MSTDPDYTYSEQGLPESSLWREPSLQLPFALLCAALAVVMVTQTINTFKTRSTLRDGKAQLAEAYRTRDPVVKQSVELQKKLQELVLDLLLLARTDDEAKAIVAKYNIQQQAPAADASVPAP